MVGRGEGLQGPRGHVVEGRHPQPGLEANKGVIVRWPASPILVQVTMCGRSDPRLPDLERERGHVAGDNGEPAGAPCEEVSWHLVQ